MRLFRAAGLRAVDTAAADTGIETYALMRTAGAAVVAALARHWPAARHVCVLCGPGNNGGDGYVAAELLGREGRQVSVLELRSDPSGADARRARADLLAAALDAVRIDGPDAHAPTDGSDVVIDALFGSGLTRDLEGVAARWAHEVTRAGTPVLAVDVPSGVRADRAGLSGPILRAHATLQLAGATIASALAPARATFGAWEVADIGLPERLLDEHAAGRLLDHDDVAAAFAPPEDDVHKYLAGTVLVVGGSRRYAGAAELAARGALRAGAGLVTLASEASAPSGWPEFVREPFEIGAAAACIEAVGAARAGATVLGPGWEVGRDALAAALEAASGPLVLDAGALAHDLAPIVRARGDAVLTPHHGEAARLLRRAGIDVDVGDDPVGAAEALANAWGAVVVLKGAGTVVADPDGRLALSRAGHPAMATGGTGDVLAGVIGALLAARGGARSAAERFERIAAATVVHGLAGEIVGEAGGGIIASDLVAALPEARRRLGRAAGRSAAAAEG